MNIEPDFKNSVEITRNAFLLLVGNEEHSWADYGSNDHAEWSIYKNEGVRLMALENFPSKVTQYFVQDINS
jgi:hypothetical protein